LTDRYHRPAIAMGRVEGKIVGSCRSIDGFDIAETLELGKEFLSRFGGHKKAGGFTLDPDKYDVWVEWLKKIASEKLTDQDLEKKEEIEMIVNLKDVNWELWDQLEKFEPFGEGNLEPVLAVKGVKLVDKQLVGDTGKHVRLFVSEDGNPKLYKIMAFSSAEKLADFKNGDIVDVAFTVSINQWNGNREIQMKLVDMVKHSDVNTGDTNDANPNTNDIDTNTRINANVANYANGNADINANIADGVEADTDVNEFDDGRIIYGDLCYKINGILYKVHNELGRNCNEKQVCDAIEQKLIERGLGYEREKVLPESFVGERFGRNRIDFIIDGRVIIEIKACRIVGREEYRQCMRYLEAFDKKLCLLANFRDKHLHIKRIINPKAKV